MENKSLMENKCNVTNTEEQVLAIVLFIFSMLFSLSNSAPFKNVYHMFFSRLFYIYVKNITIVTTMIIMMTTR